MGNLRTAWISREWARVLGVPWVVRFEDIDQPRVQVGAQEAQLADMRALGLVPDQLSVQSAFFGRHWELFERAVAAGVVYPCTCTRRQVQGALDVIEGIASAPHAEPPLYTGRCRGGTGALKAGLAGLAWRFRSERDPSGAHDFVIARTGLSLAPARDTFVPAYNWACAIDDFDGAHALLVRAWDLSHVTEQQREIQRWIGGGGNPVAAAVFHASLVVRGDGQRLEKRTRGVTLGELVTAGVSPEALLGRFRESFSETCFGEFQVSRVFGEALERIPLSALGVSGSQDA